MLSPLERAFFYDFFSDVFIYKWNEEDYNSLMEKVEELAKNYPSFKELEEKLKSTSRKDLLIEYTTLFLTGIGSRTLTPVESKRLFSIYGEKVATIKLNDLLSFYRSWGLKPKPMVDFFQPEADHISSILGFMSFLALKQHEYESKGRDPMRVVYDQRKFFQNHVLNWVPDWIDDVVSDSRSDVFKVVCRGLKKWIEQERNELGV